MTELLLTVRWDNGEILTANKNVARLMRKTRGSIVGGFFDGVMKTGLPSSLETQPENVEAMRRLAEADDTKTILGPLDDTWAPEGGDLLKVKVWLQWTNYQLKNKEGWDSTVGAFIVRARTLGVASFRQFLQEEMTAHKWRVRDLAEALGVRFGVAARWLACDEDKRVVPAPLMCFKIAKTFELDPIEVFRRAGYWPVDDDLPRNPHQDDIEGLMRLLQRIMHDIPEERWGLSHAVARSHLDALQLLLNRISEQS